MLNMLIFLASLEIDFYQTVESHKKRAVNSRQSFFSNNFSFNEFVFVYENLIFSLYRIPDSYMDI